MVEVPASETLDRVVDCAVRDFDGSGCAKSLPIENCRRDVRVNRTSQNSPLHDRPRPVERHARTL